jgi:hypothetical protein
VLSTRLWQRGIDPLRGFRFAMAQMALNGTTSNLTDARVPRKFLTMLA